MVPPVVSRDNSPPPTRLHVTLAGTPLLDQDDSQQTWLSKIDITISTISKEVVIYKNISWSAHFASLQDSKTSSYYCFITPV